MKRIVKAALFLLSHFESYMKFLTVFLLFISLTSFAQEKKQWIVQLSNKVSDENFEKNIKEEIPSFNKIKSLSKSLNISLYECSDSENAKECLKDHYGLLSFQQNKNVELRAIPSDPLFNDQWQFFNNGSNGWLDADIDALEAWNITTGGLTLNNDTIVVAVIDGGINIEHEDLKNNMWINNAEIEYNGKDDDGNGFVDDVYGWNFKTDSPDVSNEGSGNWHGTPVAGIIGADGNNDLGVTGVNWNVKVMNLVHGGTEADVIAAYDYILEMRKKYNDSNGKEGAFVVVTNSSLGIDNGNPEDSPMWCMMYDALGAVGVLSVGATSNANINVDENGDLPTTCTSDYLITVTNSTSSDEFADSGYGKEHIDLSAPGSKTFTLSNNGGYANFGGTSAAAPHVAGAVALLYATPIELFADAIKTRPKNTAKLVKQCILEGTDPIKELKDKTVSGGRLNLYNSLRSLFYKFRLNDPSQDLNIFIEAIYPNPARDFFKIYFNIIESNSIEFSLYNANWQIVESISYQNINTGIHEQLFETNDLPEGIYFLKINVGKFSTSVHKLLILSE